MPKPSRNCHVATMSSKPANYTPTAFPRLDTLAHSPLKTWRRPGLYSKRQQAYVHGSHPRSRTELLEQYSQFICAFTGESEICFAFRCRPTSNEVTTFEAVTAILSGVGDHEKAPLLSSNHLETGDETFGYALELILDPEAFHTAETPPTSESVSIFPSPIMEFC